MFNFLQFLLLLLYLLTGACISPSYGQTETVGIARSKNKVIIAGKIYYIHLVQKAETVYSICKAYNIGQKELLSENPDVAYGLKEGMNLRIPERPLPKADYLLGDTAQYIYHIVAEGQTLYAIARQYGVLVNVIMEHNPEVKYSNLQPKQVIKVPKTLKHTATTETQTENKIIQQGNNASADTIPVSRHSITAERNTKDSSLLYIYHHIVNGETLYSLARRYDLKKEDIIRFNGGESFAGLKIGDSIRIPRSGIPDTIRIAAVEHDTNQTSLPGIKDSCLCDSIRLLPKPGRMRVALLLPLSIDDFLLENQDTAMSIDDAGQRFKSTTVPLEQKEISDQNWIEFYEGFMLALNNNRDSGTNLSLKVFDAANIFKPIRLLIPEISQFNPDLIICPLVDSSYQSLIDFSYSQGIPLVTPVYPSSKLIPRNNIVSLAPSWLFTIDKVTSWIASEPDVNLIVIHSSDSLSRESVAHLRRNLPDNLIMKETIQNDTAIAQIEIALSPTMVNKVFILSDREEYVTDIIRTLVLLSRNNNIQLIGFSSWSKFRSINIEDLHSLNLVYLAPFHSDLSSPSVKSFMRSFQQLYRFYPTRTGSLGNNYALLGHDICQLSLHAFRNYQYRMPCCMAQQKYSLLLGDYCFSRMTETETLQKSSWVLVNYQPSLDLVISNPE